MTANRSANFELNRLSSETFIERVEFRQEVHSTNNFALAMCEREEISSPVLVLTERQTAGRGRGSNQWWSSDGSLTFSLIVNAEQLGLTQDLWPRASLTTGLAVCESLDAFLPNHRVGLKWPNDVHLEGLKVCGILVEVGPRQSNCLVLGIGLNVNNSFADAPKELKSIATSWIDQTDREHDLTTVLCHLINQLEAKLTLLVQRNTDFSPEWRRRCVLQGRTVQVDVGPNSFVGGCEGIDEEGALVLRTEGGIERLFGGVVVEIW